MIINTKELPYDVLFLFRIKMNEFKAEDIHDINITDIKDYIYHTKWKNKEELELCEAVDDILSITYSNVFDYMKMKSIIEAKNLSLYDFEDLLNK